MRALAQMVLPFRVEATDESLTANAGLVLFGEFVCGLGLERWLRQEMPKPGSGHSYHAVAYVTSLVLMLNDGGRSLEDMRTFKSDSALSRLLKLGILPTPDAVGDWLRRTGAGEGLMGLSRYPTDGSLLREFGKLASLLIRWMGMFDKLSPRRKRRALPTKGNKAICR
ncbi:hypothetical protein [Nitrosomonas sp. Nm132]|uniref:hypothetical protein n=1 Tax=Nitrosomonas sp. Nm132 TaxID=1881053 RepID=UPI00088BEC59|nr:hypothetical protein [Nitrosomonas sp. Nm132]SDH30905.1 hypothetical protein SAMN05428952_10103 [Nitrosomonas sp. Nm132]